MKTIIRATLLALALSASLAFAQQAGSGAEALKSLNELQQKLYSDAQKAGQRPNAVEINAAIQAKAAELVANIDIDKIEAAEAYNWAQVFSRAGKNVETCDLVKKYLTTNPDASNKYTAQMLMLSACNALGEAEMLQSTLRDIRVPNATLSTSLASSTVYQFVDTVAKKKGVGEAIETLNDVEKNLILEAPADYAKRMLAAEKARNANNPNFKPKPDDERLKELEVQGKTASASMKFMFVEKRAELLVDAGRKDEAVKAIDTFLGTLEEGSPIRRTVNGARVQMTLPGTAAPAITFERGYGDFKGLEALKGKVVILDFFAHWCGPCIASFPDMKQLYSDFKGKGLEIVGFTTYYGYYKTERGISKDAEFAKMADFIKDYDLPWPVVYGERTNFDAYGVTGIPHVAVIGRDGSVTKIKVGYSAASFKEFRAYIEKLLSE